jgi:LmbE family N-acetylglucosaminyl deacetylase
MTALSQLLEPCDLAILPNPQDWHQDHRTTYQLAWPLLRQQANTVMIMDSWPYCQNYTQINTNIHYDISAQWPFKQKLLECYSSYVTPKLLAEIHTDNHWRGLRHGFDLAETFTIVSSRVG